jgi:D-apionolactonase
MPYPADCTTRRVNQEAPLFLAPRLSNSTNASDQAPTVPVVMTNQTFPKVIPLRTRKFSCLFEPDTGFLRRIKSSGVEVIRTIYGAVRDKNWDTVEPRLKIERVESDDDSFCLEFSAQHEDEPVCFSWNGTIQGQGGSLEFRFDGRAQKSFLRNRIGLCTLHPILECAGKACRVQHSDGTWEEGSFPLFISPHQPFKDIRALSWEPSGRVRASIRFEGDVFEMEDQRNWTDASYKTYNTPLELPFPVELADGEEIHQRVVLTLFTEEPTMSAAERPPVKVAVSPALESRKLAKIGLCAASHGSPLSSLEQQRLASLRLNHLRVDLHFSEFSWKTVLRRAQDEALGINARLQCALFLNDSAQRNLLDFREAIKSDSVDICLVFHEAEKSTASRWFELAERELTPDGFRLATGTNAYFAELNRQRPPRGVIACYSINPQVHTFDDLSLFETLEAQPATVESALQFCDKELIVSPITLRPRFNPNATDPAKQREDSLSAADPRQSTLFCAAWTVGSLARLLPLDRVESLTFYETTGLRGVMNLERNSAKPDAIRAAHGKIFPVYYVFEAIAGIRSLLPVSISDETLVTAFAFKNDQGHSICLIANLKDDPKEVELQVPASELDVLNIDETNVLEATDGRLPSVDRLMPTDGRVKLALPSHAFVKLQF